MEEMYNILFSKLMNTEFKDWDAHKEGLITERGTIVRVPKTPSEQAAYTIFHGKVRALRKFAIDKNKYGVYYTYNKIVDCYGEPEMSLDEILTKFRIVEDMVAGDSGGSVDNIASGVTSGNIVSGGPSLLKKTTKSKKKDEKAP